MPERKAKRDLALISVRVSRELQAGLNGLAIVEDCKLQDLADVIFQAGLMAQFGNWREKLDRELPAWRTLRTRER